MITGEGVNRLRYRRQCFGNEVGMEEYPSLYRDMSPPQPVYWCGFGEPPTLPLRAAFDDREFNEGRRNRREIVKGRFMGGNLSYVDREDLELFACAFRKPLEQLTLRQGELLELISREGPMNIGRMKEDTGWLVKEITPVLHRLQEAFLIYEDQVDGEFDRGWYLFGEMFPQVDLGRYPPLEAMGEILPRFARRNVFIDVEMVKSFYRLPGKDSKAALSLLAERGALVPVELEGNKGYVLPKDLEILEAGEGPPIPPGYCLLNRNDFLVRSTGHLLKQRFPRKELCEGKSDILCYVMVDGEIRGAVTGQFKYGPYIVENLVVDPALEGDGRMEEIRRLVFTTDIRVSGNKIR